MQELTRVLVIYKFPPTFGKIMIQIYVATATIKPKVYKLKFGWLKFGEAQAIRQTLPLPNIPAIR